jgi:isopentenyl-diphosphate delta-isomerase
MPELSLEQIDTATRFLVRTLAAPILVSGMTGGTERAGEINRRVAEAVAALGLGMGVGSQRISVERPEVLNTFQVRSVAPEILLIANLGAVQLNYGFSPDDCRRLVDAIGADALALHLNPLQEAIQPGGNTDFRGLAGKIQAVCSALSCPVIVKEVGCGISATIARTLVSCGVAAIDIGGAGGTCWTEIEGRRSDSPATRAIAETFREWGIPTADSIRSVRAACPQIPLIASGGLRTGLDIAKSLALGADVAAVASPVLKAAVESSSAVHELLSRLVRELKLAMFCTGSARPADLRAAIHASVANRA